MPPDVLAILRKTLAPRPEDRYASAADFKRELEKLLYGGAYSPTTFNLALFMDRLYRNEIEQEDRELERERTLDVAAYYQPPKVEVPEAPAPVPEAPKTSRTFLYVIAGGAAVLLAVIAYLLQPAGVAAARRSGSTEAHAAGAGQHPGGAGAEGQGRTAAQRARGGEGQDRRAPQAARNAEAGCRGRHEASGERRAAELQRELAAREAEQKRKEEELAKVRQQQEAEAARAREQQAQARAAGPGGRPDAVAAGARSPCRGGGPAPRLRRRCPQRRRTRRQRTSSRSPPVSALRWPRVTWWISRRSTHAPQVLTEATVVLPRTALMIVENRPFRYTGNSPGYRRAKGHGTQYRQPVQPIWGMLGTLPYPLEERQLLGRKGISPGMLRELQILRHLAEVLDAVSATGHAGWFQIQRRAHFRGSVLRGLNLLGGLPGAGGWAASFPPSSGSMATTATSGPRRTRDRL